MNFRYLIAYKEGNIKIRSGHHGYAFWDDQNRCWKLDRELAGMFIGDPMTRAATPLERIEMESLPDREMDGVSFLSYTLWPMIDPKQKTYYITNDGYQIVRTCNGKVRYWDSQAHLWAADPDLYGIYDGSVKSRLAWRRELDYIKDLPDNPPLIDKCVYIAALAHHGQKDKSGADYIHHPLAVSKYMETEYGKAAALLHDVVEDSKFTLDDLKNEDLPVYVIEAVDALTRRENEEYSDYLRRVKANPLAQKVKIFDLTDNLREDRLRLLDEKTAAALKEKYQKALEFMKQPD